jgi:hypothetical protein
MDYQNWRSGRVHRIGASFAPRRAKNSTKGIPQTVGALNSELLRARRERPPRKAAVERTLVDVSNVPKPAVSNRSKYRFYSVTASARYHISELDGKFTARDGAVVRKPNIKPTRAPESLA